jgi:hypothetical protein
MRSLTRPRHSRADGSFFHLMRDIFVLSHCALLRNLDRRPDFAVWCVKKQLYDRRLSLLVFRYLARDPETRDTFAAHEAFNASYLIYMRHMARRVQLYRLCKRLGLGSAGFTAIAIVDSYVDVAVRLAVGIFRQSREMMIGDLPVAGEVVVAVKFPAHSFAVPQALHLTGEAPAVYSSLGSYLQRHERERPVVSVGEYVRHSKAVDGTAAAPPADRFVVHSLAERRSWRRFGAAVGTTLRGLIRALDLRRSLLRLETARSEIVAGPYADLIDRLDARGTRVTSIYGIPFDDLGALRTKPKYWSRLVNVNYSRNVSIPPAPDMLAPGLLPIHLYYFSGSAVGFTQVFAEIGAKKAEVAKQFGVALPSPDKILPAEVPLQLGFELTSFEAKPEEGPYVALFDVPPHGMDHTLSLWICGDRTSEVEVNEGFLREAVAASAENGFCVLLKPKYALTNYTPSYRALLEELAAQFPGHLKLVRPYTELTSLLESASVAISFPYTSTSAIATALGIPSAFFFPGTHANSLFRRGQNESVLCGRDELGEFLRNARSQVSAIERIET